MPDTAAAPHPDLPNAVVALSALVPGSVLLCNGLQLYVQDGRVLLRPLPPHDTSIDCLKLLALTLAMDPGLFCLAASGCQSTDPFHNLAQLDYTRQCNRRRFAEEEP